MDVLVPDSIRKSPRFHAAAEIATEILESESPPSGGTVRAEWSTYRNEFGREGLDLAISDGTEAAMTRIPGSKLLDRDFLFGRMIRIWGDLLHKQSHTLRDRFRAKYATIGEE